MATSGSWQLTNCRVLQRKNAIITRRRIVVAEAFAPLLAVANLEELEVFTNSANFKFQKNLLLE
jgi:hypothetical protein